jgi:hypothetical protein
LRSSFHGRRAREPRLPGVPAGDRRCAEHARDSVTRAADRGAAASVRGRVIPAASTALLSAVDPPRGVHAPAGGHGSRVFGRRRRSPSALRLHRPQSQRGRTSPLPSAPALPVC